MRRATTDAACKSKLNNAVPSTPKRMQRAPPLVSPTTSMSPPSSLATCKQVAPPVGTGGPASLERRRSTFESIGKRNT
jgi:hypothetical protein